MSEVSCDNGEAIADLARCFQILFLEKKKLKFYIIQSLLLEAFNLTRLKLF